MLHWVACNICQHDVLKQCSKKHNKPGDRGVFVATLIQGPVHGERFLPKSPFSLTKKNTLIETPAGSGADAARPPFVIARSLSAAPLVVDVSIYGRD